MPPTFPLHSIAGREQEDAPRNQWSDLGGNGVSGRRGKGAVMASGCPRNAKITPPRRCHRLLGDTRALATFRQSHGRFAVVSARVASEPSTKNAASKAKPCHPAKCK